MISDKLPAFGGTLTSSPPSAARHPLRIAFALLAYSFIAWLIYRGIDREHFSLGFSQLRPEHIALILLIAIAHIGVRALRFDRLMRSAGASSRYRLQDGVRLFLIGLSASAVTPGRAGDLIKARLVRDFGIGLNRGFGLVLVERVLDLLALCCSMVGAGTILSGRVASDGWRLAALVLLASMLSGMLVLVSPRVRDPLLQSCARIASRLLPSLREEVVLGHLREMLTVWDEVFRSPVRFLGYFAVSLCAWSIEFTKLWVVLSCLGVHMDLVFAFFVYPASILAGLLSLLPISDAVVGVTGAVLMHTLAGVANGMATTAIVVDRTASVVPPLLLWGFFAFLQRRHDAR
ncbi:MAG TPA: lysylphosphatidylglycerol synthase transmembrane domain-containing protein [Polyangiales bacterium]|jgi:uncharacterized protein (TIRG00374 family)